MFSRKQNFIREEKFVNRAKAVSSWQIALIPLRLLPHLLLVFLLGILLIGIFAGISLAPYYASLKVGYEAANSGANHLLAAEKFIGEKKISLAGQELLSAENDFNAANVALDIVSKAALFKSGLANDQLEIAKKIIEIGGITAGSLKNITNVGEEIQKAMQTKELSWSGITEQDKERVLKILAGSVHELKKSQEEFRSAGVKLVEINKRQPLFIFDGALRPLSEKIPKVQKAFDSMVVMAELLPALTGYPAEKTYLFIFENNREMRPAGGFIGTYGILKVKNAGIKKFFTDNSYNFDKPAETYLKIESPAAMAKYMNQPKWFFRDSNWWPDFPASAEKAEWFYKEQKGQEKLDGVIALTPTVIENFLGILGEFKIEKLTFNKDNFWDQLQYQVEYGYYKQGITEADRKDVIGELGEKMIERLELIAMSQWPELIETISTSVEEKQLMMFFNDENLQDVAAKNGWTGEVKSFAGDYLMLVDANLAALKTDSVMSRTLAYKLSQDKSGVLIADAKVNYQNTGDFSWKTTRYRTYTRLYVPAGSKLISVKAGNKVIDEKDIDIYNEFNKTAFGVFFEVEPQSSKEVEWVYELPRNVSEQIDQGEYQLMVQKQPGILSMNLHLDLNFPKNILSQKSGLFGNNKELKHVETIKQDQIYTVWLEK